MRIEAGKTYKANNGGTVKIRSSMGVFAAASDGKLLEVFDADCHKDNGLINGIKSSESTSLAYFEDGAPSIGGRAHFEDYCIEGCEAPWNRTIMYLTRARDEDPKIVLFRDLRPGDVFLLLSPGWQDHRSDEQVLMQKAGRDWADPYMIGDRTPFCAFRIDQNMLVKRIVKWQRRTTSRR